MAKRAQSQAARRKARLFGKDSRRRAHISNGDRAFLPVSRMREIRWEESVARARAKRDQLVHHKIVHADCHCGSIGCLGVPIVVSSP